MSHLLNKAIQIDGAVTMHLGFGIGSNCIAARNVAVNMLLLVLLPNSRKGEITPLVISCATARDPEIRPVSKLTVQ